MLLVLLVKVKIIPDLIPLKFVSVVMFKQASLLRHEVRISVKQCIFAVDGRISECEGIALPECRIIIEYLKMERTKKDHQIQLSAPCRAA